MLDRRDVPDELVGGGVDQLGFRLQELELVAVLEQGEQAAGDHARRRVVAGGRDDHVVAERVHVGQRLAVDLGVGDDRREVAGGVGPAIGGQVGEVVHEVEQHLDRGLVLAQRAMSGSSAPKSSWVSWSIRA